MLMTSQSSDIAPHRLNSKRSASKGFWHWFHTGEKIRKHRNVEAESHNKETGSSEERSECNYGMYQRTGSPEKGPKCCSCWPGSCVPRGRSASWGCFLRTLRTRYLLGSVWFFGGPICLVVFIYDIVLWTLSKPELTTGNSIQLLVSVLFTACGKTLYVSQGNTVHTVRARILRRLV